MSPFLQLRRKRAPALAAATVALVSRVLRRNSRILGARLAVVPPIDPTFADARGADLPLADSGLR